MTRMPYILCCVLIGASIALGVYLGGISAPHIRPPLTVHTELPPQATSVEIPTTGRVYGTLDHIDASTRALTLRTDRGLLRFTTDAETIAMSSTFAYDANGVMVGRERGETRFAELPLETLTIGGPILVIYPYHEGGALVASTIFY